ASQDVRDAPAFVGRRVPVLAQCPPQLASRLAQLAVVLFVFIAALEGPANVAHAVADAFELREQRLHGGAVLVEMPAPLLADAIELLGPLRLDRGVARLLQ